MFELIDNQGRSVPLDEMDPQHSMRIQFAPHFVAFSANQTVCMSFQDDNQLWSGDTCLTDVDARSNAVVCRCSMIGS